MRNQHQPEEVVRYGIYDAQTRGGGSRRGGGATISIQTYIHTYIHPCMHIYIYIHLFIYIYIYIYIYNSLCVKKGGMYIYIYMHLDR